MAIETMPQAALDTARVVRARREGQLGLMWRRFKRHRLALVSLWIVAAFYLVAIFAEFLAPADPAAYSARYTFAPPQGLRFFSTDADGSWSFSPHVNGYKSEIDRQAMRRTFVIDPETEIPVQFFVPSEPYKLAGFIPMSVKLIGVTEPRAPFYMLGADRLGRDLLSRLIHGTRISLSIGLVGVTMSLFFGIVIGGFAGYYGGWFDSAVHAHRRVHPLDADHPAVARARRGDAAGLVAAADLLRHHPHPQPDRLDRARARGARPLPQPRAPRTS